MAAKKEDPKCNWLCEDCGTVHVSIDPPDECKKCAHIMFDNLADLVAESERKTKH